MKWWILLMGSIAMSAGCQQATPAPAPQARTHSVLDVAPAGPLTAADSPARMTTVYTGPSGQSIAPVYLPPGASAPSAVSRNAAVVVEPPVAPNPPAQSINAVAANDAANRYTVKHGDTLFRIAKMYYGEGKKWQQIAAANPGVTPASLKVGQKLVMP